MADFSEFNAMAIQEQLPNIHVMKAWRIKHRAKANRAKMGEQLILPDTLQVYTFVSTRFVRINKHRQIWNVWQSRCPICGIPFTFSLNRKRNSMVRTCPAHRGQWRAPRRPAAPKPRRERSTPIRDAILAELAACALVARSVPLEALAQGAIDRLPDRGGQRDTRRQNVTRAMQRLADTGALQLSACGTMAICN